MSQQARDGVAALVQQCEYVELSSSSAFSEFFIEAIEFPEAELLEQIESPAGIEIPEIDALSLLVTTTQAASDFVTQAIQAASFDAVGACQTIELELRDEVR